MQLVPTAVQNYSNSPTVKPLKRAEKREPIPNRKSRYIRLVLKSKYQTQVETQKSKTCKKNLKNSNKKWNLKYSIEIE
jgi:hypothetical protein